MMSSSSNDLLAEALQWHGMQIMLQGAKLGALDALCNVLLLEASKSMMQGLA